MFACVSLISRNPERNCENISVLNGVFIISTQSQMEISAFLTEDVSAGTAESA